jgi:hypothetical protein
MTFGQILDRIYRITRANFRSLLAIAFVPSFVSILFILGLEALFFLPLIRQLPNPPSHESFAQLSQFLNPAIMFPAFLLITILNGALMALYFAAAIHAATQADRGFTPSFSESWQFGWSRMGRYLWLMLLIYAVAFLPAVVIELAFFGAASLLSLGKAAPNPAVFLLIPLGMLLFLAAFVYAIVMGLRLSLAFPASVVEGLSARAALKRSGHLTQGAKGRIFLVFLVEYAILYAVMMVSEWVIILLGLLGYMAWSALQIHLSPPWSYIAIGFGLVLAMLALSLYSALTWVGMSSSLAVLYHDQRLRTDRPLPAPIPPGAIA